MPKDWKLLVDDDVNTEPYEATPRPGMLEEFWALASAHAAISVPISLAVVFALTTWAVDVLDHAFRVSQADALNVPPAFIAEVDAAQQLGKGLMILLFVGILVLISAIGSPRPTFRRLALFAGLFVAPVIYMLLFAPGGVGDRIVPGVAVGVDYVLLAGLWVALALAGRAVRRRLRLTSDRNRLIGAVGLALIVTGGGAVMYVSGVFVLAYVGYQDKTIGDSWVVKDTVGTDNPVLVLDDGAGNRLLLSLSRLPDGRFAACDPAELAPPAFSDEIVWVEDLGSLNDRRSACP